MAVNGVQMLKMLRSLKEVCVAYAMATNMPFVTCDEETFNDQVWVFSSLEGVRKFAKKYEEQKISFKGVQLKQEYMSQFYMDLYAMGINEIVFCEGDVQEQLELSKLIKVPDYSKLPENKRPLLNPALQLSTVYFLQEVRRPGADLNSEKPNELAEEMYANLARARFLMPVQMEAATEKEGKLSLPFITDKKGNKFQPVFSDHNQYMKYISKNKTTANTRVLIVGIAELQKYLLKNLQGYMLNPNGYCHIISEKQLAFIVERFGE